MGFGFSVKNSTVEIERCVGVGVCVGEPTALSCHDCLLEIRLLHRLGPNQLPSYFY